MEVQTVRIDVPHSAQPMRSFRDRAAVGLKYGIPVIALHGKMPYWKGWENRGFTNQTQVDEHNSKHPADNAGLVAKAEPGGFCVLEVDSPDVAKRYKQDTGEDLPNDTLIVASRPELGRRHRWFRHTLESISLGNISQSDVPYGDFSFRAHNQQAVAPLSIHPDTGREYKLVRDVPPIPIPEKLVAWLATQTKRLQPAKAAGTPATADAPATAVTWKIPHGQIYGACTKQSGKLWRDGYPPDSIPEMLVQWAHANCEPPLDDDKIRQYARGNNWANGNGIEEYPQPLGHSALQGVVGEFVNAALPYTEADENCLGYQFLTAIGNAIGRKVYVNFGADRHYPNLFLLTVGGTGTGKGQALNNVKQLMRLADPEWERGHCKYSAASGEAIVRLCAEATGQYKSGDDEDDDERPHNGDGRLLLLLNEISILWNSMNREYANTSGYLRAGYDGGPLENNRARSKVVATDYALSLISHVTPEELGGLLDNNVWYNGFVNRFIFAVVSKSKTLPRMNRTPDYTKLAEKLSKLLALPYTGPVEFSEDGGNAWDTWVHSLPEPDGLVGAAMQRVRPNALRVALIYACLDEARLVFPNAPFKIEARHVQTAIEVIERSMASVRWFLSRPPKTGLQDDKIRRIRKAANEKGGQLTGRELASLLSHETADVRQRLASDAGLRLEITTPDGGGKAQVWKN